MQKLDFQTRKLVEIAKVIMKEPQILVIDETSTALSHDGSLANPYHLIDVPMIKTYINGYSNSEYVIDAVVEKIMGRSRFEGKTPVDPFCGKEYLKW